MGPGPLATLLLATLLLGGSGSLWPLLRAAVSEGASATSTQVLYPLVQVIALCLQRPAQLLQPLSFHLQALQLFVPECLLGRARGPFQCHANNPPPDTAAW